MTAKADRNVFSIVCCVFGLVTFFACFTTVNSGTVGVVTRFGKVREEALEAGFHFKMPWLDKVKHIDIKMQPVELVMDASSSDLQQVSAAVTLQYSLVKAFVPQVYRTIGADWQVKSTVITPGMNEAVKAVCANFTADQLIGERNKVKTMIKTTFEDFIDATLESKSIQQAITIANIAITNLEFSEEFNKAIELKVKTAQEALQAQNEKQKIITQAEAFAAQKKIKANATAYYILAESTAKAQAIKAEAESLKDNTELINLRFAERWNGILPRFTAGSQIPFLDTSRIITPIEEGG